LTDVEEYVADDVFRDRGLPGQSHDKAMDAHIVAHEKQDHGALVADRN